MTEVIVAKLEAFVGGTFLGKTSIEILDEGEGLTVLCVHLGAPSHRNQLSREYEKIPNLYTLLHFGPIPKIKREIARLILYCKGDFEDATSLFLGLHPSHDTSWSKGQRRKKLTFFANCDHQLGLLPSARRNAAITWAVLQEELLSFPADLAGGR